MCPSPAASYWRCFTLHGTNGALVKDTTCFDVQGSGYYIEVRFVSVPVDRLHSFEFVADPCAAVYVPLALQDGAEERNNITGEALCRPRPAAASPLHSTSSAHGGVSCCQKCCTAAHSCGLPLQATLPARSRRWAAWTPAPPWAASSLRRRSLRCRQSAPAVPATLQTCGLFSAAPPPLATDSHAAAARGLGRGGLLHLKPPQLPHQQRGLRRNLWLHGPRAAYAHRGASSGLTSRVPHVCKLKDAFAQYPSRS